jgi:predicted transcriptional regulator
VGAASESLRGKQRSYALFLEPQLDTGFPDIVLVGFNPRVFEKWVPGRNKITIVDIKVLHHLHFTGGADAAHIETQLGLDSRSLVQSIERLLSASLIRWSAKRWVPNRLRKTYAINAIQAIEVKMKNWADAFQQAEMNCWFASESYVLSPVLNPTERIVKASKSLGVGIYIMPMGSQPKRLIHARKTHLPGCYASWLFNEWIGRRLNG